MQPPQQQQMSMNMPQQQPQGGAMPLISTSEGNPYGVAPISGNTPEAIAKSLASLTPELMFKVIQEMKHLAQTNPKKCRHMLDTNPQLSFALLQAQVMMHWVNTDTAFNLLDRNMNQEKMQERTEMASRGDDERPGPGMIPQPAFRPTMPQQPQPEHQFFNDHGNMYRPPFRPGMPPQQGPPRQVWSGPPQQRYGGPPPQHFRGAAPFQNQPQDFGDSFRNYGNRPNMPPAGFQGQRPAFGQPLPPQNLAFRDIRPQNPDFHQQHRRNEPDDEDDMIQQLLRLTNDQIAELDPDEQVKVRQLREQFGR